MFLPLLFALIGSQALPWKVDPATIVLHRAAGMVAPENTWPALFEAVRQGADVVEIDVRRLRDGSLVLYHDDWLPATPFGPGRSLESLPAHVARSVAPGDRWGASWAHEALPEFREVVQFAKANDLHLFLDLKTPGIVEDVMRTVDQLGARRLIVAVGGTGRVSGLRPIRWVQGWNYTDGGEEDPLRMQELVGRSEPEAAFMVSDARSVAMALGRVPSRRHLSRVPISSSRRDVFSPPPLPSSIDADNSWILTVRPREAKTEQLIDLAEGHPDPQVRLDAVIALGNGGHVSAIPRLARLFERPDPVDPASDPIGRPFFNTYLRTSIACALAAMPPSASRPTLAKLSRSRKEFAVEAVATGLAARGRAEDIPFIAELVRQRPAAAGFVLGFVGRFELDAWPLYMAVLDVAGGQDRKRAVFMVAALGEAAIDRVVSEMTKASGPQQVSLAHSLYWMETPRDQEARQRVLKLADLSPETRSVLTHPRPWTQNR